MLKNIKLLFLTAIFVTICYKEVFTTTSYRDRVIGCLFSDVCSPNEACFDDNAFGRCEDYDPVSKKYSSHYVYDLDRKTLQLLEKELDRLSEEGFTWNDSYAQCVLKTVLNDRPRIVYDPTSCNYRRFPEPIVDLLVSDKTHREQPDSDLPSQAKPRQDDNIFPTFSPSPQQSPSGPSDSLPIVPSLFGKGAKQNQLAQSSSTRSKLTNELLSESLPSSSPSSPLNSYQTIKAQTQINSNDKEFSDVNRKPIGGSKQTQLSDNVIKSKLRSEYLKRSSPGRLNTNSDSQFPDELNDQDLSEAVQNQLLQVLLGNLKNSDSISQFGSDNNNEYSEPVQPLPDNYLAYSADNIPYLSNPQPDRKYDQQSEDELLQSYGPQYQPVWFRKTPIASPLVPKAYSSDANQLEDDDHNNIYIVKGPLPDIFNRPEIRVLRDANQDQNEDILVKPIGDNELASDEDVAQLLPMLQSPSDPDVIMVDVIENDGNTNEPNDDDYAKLIDNILGQSQNKANKDDSSMEDELIGSVVNLNGFNQNDDDVDEDDDEDEKINKEMKEMLFGDINYNNNYDTKMPNFYRKHRYDIKKPGPKYYEEYFFKPDNEESSEVEKSNDEPLLIENKVMESLEDSPIMKKKDNNIRSSKPVAEGPVKVDAKSENTIIIRSAEEGEETSLEAIDSTHTYVVTDKMLGEEDSQKFVQTLEQVFKLPRGTFSNLRKEEFQITFKVNPNYRDLNASQVASRIEDLANVIKDITGYNVKETGIGDKTKLPVVSATIIKKSNEKLINITLLICSVILAIISAAFIIFLFRRNGKFREKVKGFVKISEDWMNFDYQDLCRQRMQGKSKEKEESPKKGNLTGSNESVNKLTNGENLASQQGSEAPQNSSNRVEEPVLSNMDISTGHIILSYMEDHLKKKDRLDQEWEALCAYEADPCATNAASQKQNANKNRYPDILPYDHSRVILNDLANSSNSDYINANTITDHDPRNPAYIVTQGPLSNTKADFWQMIWEQGSVIIVMLTRLRENGLSMCDRYWPEEGTETYQNYEVNLVSEHIWCEDYLVRSFYLKNLKTSETRTVTQFHFLSWPENGIPPNTKSILDFRRKVNKSYKGRSCPTVVHCSDGIGRTGTYILIDMVLNRLAKGAKEIDIAATLEHIRDQRPGIVKNKAQFEFVLLAVAEEVQAILKALSQNN